MEKSLKATKNGTEMYKDVEDRAKAAVERLSAAQPKIMAGTPPIPVYKSAWMDWYGIEHILTQDFVLSFSLNGGGPVCWKTIDSATLALLMPILNCDSIYVTWDVAKKEQAYIRGVTKKKNPPW